jgi:crossover junction endodeoxyribonuclease RuvC
LRILGIDPGSAVTGFGVVDRVNGELVHVTHGTLRPPRSAPLAVRLDFIYRGVGEVIRQHRPDVAVVEQVFVAASARAALVLGQARGVVLAALAAGEVSVSEYAATRVKQAVTGSGRAPKRQVQDMVRRLLALDGSPALDASDALAAAICHAHEYRLRDVGVVGRARPRRMRRGNVVRAVRRP